MSTARKVAYNTVVQVIGRVLGLAIMLVTVNYVSGHLIVDGSALVGFGQYTIVFTYVSIIGSLADLGLFTLLVREITGKTPKEAGQLIGSGIIFRLILLAMTMIVFGSIYAFLPYSPVVKDGILMGVIIAFSMLFSQMVATIFQANLLSDRIVFVETIGKVLIAIGTILALKMGFGLFGVVAANLFGHLITLSLSLLLAQPLVEIKLGFDWELWKKLQPQFWSIAIINILALVHFKVDMLLMTFFRSEAEVGIYGVAYKILEVILIVPSIVATNLLPVLSNFFISGDQETMGQVVKRSASVLFLIATFISIFVFIFAPSAIVFITNNQYLAAVLPLRILTVSILFVFLTTLLSQAIVATRDQSQLVKGYVGVVILNIILNLFAIPRYSYIGAATTTVITEAVLLAYTSLIARRKFNGAFSLDMMSRITVCAVATVTIMLVANRWLIEIAERATEFNKAVQAGYLGLELLLTGIVYFLCLLIISGGSMEKWKTLFKLQ